MFPFFYCHITMQSLLAGYGLCLTGTEGRSVTQRGYIVRETISFSTFWMESTETILKYIVKLLCNLINWKILFYKAKTFKTLVEISKRYFNKFGRRITKLQEHYISILNYSYSVLELITSLTGTGNLFYKITGLRCDQIMFSWIGFHGRYS